MSLKCYVHLGHFGKEGHIFNRLEADIKGWFNVLPKGQERK